MLVNFIIDKNWFWSLLIIFKVTIKDLNENAIFAKI